MLEMVTNLSLSVTNDRKDLIKSLREEFSKWQIFCLSMGSRKGKCIKNEVFVMNDFKRFFGEKRINNSWHKTKKISDKKIINKLLPIIGVPNNYWIPPTQFCTWSRSIFFLRVKHNLQFISEFLTGSCNQLFLWLAPSSLSYHYKQVCKPQWAKKRTKTVLLIIHQLLKYLSNPATAITCNKTALKNEKKTGPISKSIIEKNASMCHDWKWLYLKVWLMFFCGLNSPTVLLLHWLVGIFHPEVSFLFRFLRLGGNYHNKNEFAKRF